MGNWNYDVRLREVQAGGINLGVINLVGGHWTMDETPTQTEEREEGPNTAWRSPAFNGQAEEDAPIKASKREKEEEVEWCQEIQHIDNLKMPIELSHVGVTGDLERNPFTGEMSLEFQKEGVGEGWTGGRNTEVGAQTSSGAGCEEEKKRPLLERENWGIEEGWLVYYYYYYFISTAVPRHN